MKSPLWIITSALTILLFAVIVSIIFSAKKIVETPRATPIKVPTSIVLEEEKEINPKDFRMIYEEKDIFGTYKPMAIPEAVTETLPVLPPPPFPRPVMPRQRPSLQFLPPLPIKISGIIASNKDENSQVSLLNTNTRKTTSYKVGEMVMDAYVLRIFPRKLIILRSNGQQETLFMYPEDAQLELENLKDVTWTDVVQQQTATSFLLNPTSFAARMASLAGLIDALDATPAVKEGAAIGIRVGKMDRSSIGYALGFQPGDLITHVADISTDSTENRMKAYNKAVQMKMGSVCTVTCVRNGRQLKLSYTLFNLADTSIKKQTPAPIVGPQQMGSSPMTTGPSPHMADTRPYQGTMNSMQQKDREAMNVYGSRQSMVAPQQPQR